MLYPNVLEQLAEERKGNLIVIPSSIHEAILLTDSEMAKVQELNETILTVNETTAKRTREIIQSSLLL